MHGKGRFTKNKVSICVISIEGASVSKIFPRPAGSNGLIVVKLKQATKKRCYVYSKPVRPNIIYQALKSIRIFPAYKVSQAKKSYIFQILVGTKMSLKVLTKTLFQRKQNMVQLMIH